MISCTQIQRYFSFLLDLWQKTLFVSYPHENIQYMVSTINFIIVIIFIIITLFGVSFS